MNTLFVVLLAIAAASGENLCSPGSFFRMDCNMCTCSEDGKAMACTDMACSGQNRNLDNMETTQTAGNLCTPGSFFRMDCNVCTCSKNGKAMACTDKACPLTLEAHQNAENLCTPESFFRIDCNMCTCSKDGKVMACTDKACPNNLDVLQTESKQVCTPRSQFKDFCNTCACADDGLSFACTRMMCDENIWNKDGSLKVAKRNVANIETEVGVRVCQPNTHFKEYCNTCVCSKDGLSKACTFMRCDKNVFNEDGSLKIGIQNLSSEKKQVCKAGSMYRPDNCNVCVCNKDGTDFACSLKICLPTLHPGYGQEEQPKQSHLYKQGEACTRGKYFNSGCNICVCTNSGTSAYCTMNSCRKET